MAIFSKQKKSDQDQAEKELTLQEMKEQKSAVGSTAKKVVTAKKVKADTKNAYRVLYSPLISEKNTHHKSANKYVFKVASTTNKIEIKKAIEALYDVKPIAVQIIIVGGRVRKYGKTSGRTKDFKKAIVTLPQGVSLDIYEGV